MLRLPNLHPTSLAPEQIELHEKILQGINLYLQGFITHQQDGTLIGPFNELIHFPTFGAPVWDLVEALAGGSTLPVSSREVVILLTGSRLGSIYELYSHESLARDKGLAAEKIRTLAVGGRPSGLDENENIAFDMAAVLNKGHQVPSSLYKASIDAFGIEGTAEIAFLVGLYTLICSLLNVFDVDLPGTETGIHGNESA